MTTSAISGTGSGASGIGSAADTLRDVNIDDFLKLMITELQNQDPLNPMDNSQILQQISQIREIASNEKLITTLEAVLAGQNLSSASTLIGKQIAGLSTSNKEVSGTVDRVSVASGKVHVHVGDAQVALNNIRDIRTSGAAPTDEAVEETAPDES